MFILRLTLKPLLKCVFETVGERAHPLKGFLSKCCNLLSFCSDTFSFINYTGCTNLPNRLFGNGSGPFKIANTYLF